MFENILSLYGLSSIQNKITSFGDGLINYTWKICSGSKNYILQKVNDDVFKKPTDIDKNIALIKCYLDNKEPSYLFVSPLKSIAGPSLIKTQSGYYRLFPFVEGSRSLNSLTNKEEAFEAAKQFGKFSRILADFDANELNITIPDFHNLSLRYEQFTAACINASPQRLANSKGCIAFINSQNHIVDIYRKIVDHQEIPLRVIHHDTKISNVLFDQYNNGICVIDLDTVMPGFFISDVGDMMRTYLAEANEEEQDLDKIQIRKDFYYAIHDGYMEEMKLVLTPEEKQYFKYAGKFIIYMQAIRFLTDYLQNDIYYGSSYEGHNFNRAKNQIALLKAYIEIEREL